MSSQNRRRLRRRRDEDGEDNESVLQRIDDSQSENSLPSDDDGDADDSDLSEAERPGSLSPENQVSTANGAVKAHSNQPSVGPTVPDGSTSNEGSFAKSQDTQAMMNGLSISDVIPPAEALDFDGSTGPAVVTSDVPVRPPSGLRRRENFAEQRRRDHEEYKKKRDADPAFIPNRGAFFMHDQRSSQAQNGARLLGRGRGRGTVVGGPFSPANMRPQPPDATRAAWIHDLHDTIQDPPHARSEASQQHFPISMPAVPPRSSTGAPVGQAIVRNYSTTRELGHVQVRIQLPGMKDAVTYGNTLIRQYTKLPDHRPPLRRDKPVRISIPEKAPRYIFPAVDRSFIFIPRALRPNQQGFGRGRTKLGSVGGYSSRRTSVFGGSVYSPSVAMSRRSSFARDFRDTLVSPAGSVRPVVRMPPGSHHSTAVGTPHAMSGQGTPVMNGPAVFPLGPQKPAYRENWPTNVPMHQPRPQKPMSVAGIETPASNFHPPQPQPDQPFSHQLPSGVAAVNGQAMQPMQQGYYPQQQYPTQTAGTPLSNIPERAIHAPAFQPYQQPGFQPAPGYYYPSMQPQFQSGGVIAPMVMQNGQQGGYLVPTIAPGPAPPAQPVQQPAVGQPGVQHYEQNGMVFYYDPSQMYMQPVEGQQYGNYAMPGIGGMMTPAPDGSGYYYPMQSGTVYYPQQ